MLTKKQWQWIADHDSAVRSWTIRVFILILVTYVAMMMKVTLDKGKSPTPYRPATDFRGQFACKEKLAPYNMGPFGGNIPSSPEFYEDANIFRLERHYTEMLEVEALLRYPECIGAFLADSVDDPDPIVFLVFDKRKGRVVYRLARINDVLKR